jgi:hypothetical protein
MRSCYERGKKQKDEITYDDRKEVIPSLISIKPFNRFSNIFVFFHLIFLRFNYPRQKNSVRDNLINTRDFQSLYL